MKWHDISEKEWKQWIERGNYVIDSSTYDSSVLHKYKFVEIPQTDDDNISAITYIQNVIALCNNYPEIKTRIFNAQSKINCEQVYQYAYFLAVHDLFEYIEKIGLLKACADIVKSITPDSLIGYSLFADVELPKLTEHDVFEVLRYIPMPTMLTLVNCISATQEIHMQVKECILKADEETFINLIVSNRISFDPIIADCNSLILLSSIKESLEWMENITEGNIGKTFIFKTPIIKNDVSIKRLETSLEQGEEATVDYYLSLAQNEQYGSLLTHISFLITKITLLSTVCPNYELTKNFNNLIAQEEFLKEIQEKYGSIDKIECIHHDNFNLPILEEFKHNFIIDLPLPPSCGKKKDIRECFSGNTIRHEVDMTKLYRSLTNADFLNWDEDTCFSFMYRTCTDYRPSEEDADKMLKSIVWKGEVRDLLAMVYHLFFGDKQLWKKCKKFFLNPQGNPLKIPSGCINMAKAPTDKMENILKDKSFR
ncbi:MAG: hypothetical protein K2M93_00075 [Muribaculaceae bacterium]|nr:hypothetical protein [Muribaculaceae bacterium]